MKRKLLFLLLTSFIISIGMFFSCKTGDIEVNPEFARYISAYSAGRISSSSSLQIELTQDLPSVEIDKEIEEDLFSFSPSIKGRAYWTSNRTIKFVPEPGELKSGQKYEGKFKLNKVLNVESDFKTFKFGFHTPNQDFKLNLLPYSPIKQNDVVWNSVEGELLLADNASLDKIHEMISIEGEKDNKPKIKVSPSANGRYHIAIDSLKRNDTETNYKLTINGKPIGIDKEENFDIILPALKEFKVIDVRTVYEPQEGIRISFSNTLSLNQNIQGLVNPSGIDNYSYNVDKNILTLYLSDNSESETVNLKIYKELKDVDGKQLATASEHSLNFAKNMPAIKLEQKGNILPNAKNLVVPFQAVNLWAVDLRIIKIFENNILGYLQANDMGGYSELKRYGRLVLQKRIRLDEDPTLDLKTWNNFSLDLAQMIEQDPGSLYRIELSMKQEYSLYGNKIVASAPESANMQKFGGGLTDVDMREWDNSNSYYYSVGEYDWHTYDWEDREDPNTPSYYMGKVEQSIVLASNIGLTAKLEDNNKLLVAVNDILTTKPLSDVTIDVYNFQMQKIGSQKTEKHGFANIGYKGGVPFAIIATHGKEKGYLKISSNLALSLSNFDVSGKSLPKGLKGYIYGERGVWRPGDSIYLSFILEDKEKILPKGHPVELEFFTPRRQLHNRTIKTNAVNGFYTFNLATNADSETGNWLVNINVGGVSFAKQLKIETVKPNRLKIRFKTAELIDASKGSISGTISSQWLHGAPARNLKSIVEMTLSTASTPFEGYESYTFNNPATNFYTDTYTLFDGHLNAGGEASVNSRLPQAASAPGMLKANIVSRVFEVGGDASIYAETVAYSPYSHYVGIKTTNDEGTRWLETDADNPIEIVSLTKEGKPSGKNKINLKVYKINWSWWWDSSRDNLASYVNNTSTEVVLDETITTKDGKGKVNLNIAYPEWGRYLVMAHDELSGHTTGKVVYVDWPSWRGRSSKEDPSGLTMLSFTPDKYSYKVGETATITIPKSSDGRALISIEQGNKILNKGWLETSSKEDVKYSFTVTEDLAPNFYISANLLQPHDQEHNSLPIRLYGIQNISVEDENTILEPIIRMPEELRPEKEFVVNVTEKNKRNMTYTIAIVDEGLLDLTAFRTPNAWSDFYARQSLGVKMWDIYDMVIGKNSGKMGPLLSIGGDEALKPSSTTMTRFKPVVKFYGPFEFKGGKVNQHKITLPAYFGAVRAMVVAGDGNGAYGKAEQSVQVKNPLMILSTLPRVAGPDEEILVPVNVFAMSKDMKNVQVSVESKGLFQFVGEKTKSVSFTEEGDKTLFFKVKVANKTGYETVKITASGAGETVTETIDIEIRNPNPQILLGEQAIVGAGESVDLSLLLDNVSVEDWAKLEVSRMPSVNLSQNLAFLLDYPHGCTEQVTSKVFPLLYVKSFKSFTDKEKEKIEFNIKEGIKIISARQLSNGGFVYWPGNNYPTEWVTTYAGHFLVEAQRAGYDVPSSVITKWTSFQKNSAQNWNRRELYNSYYNYGMNDLQQAYRLYSLALVEAPELGSMNRLKEMSDISPQARWRLASAYLLAGKKDAAKQLIEDAPDMIESYSTNNNTYGSPSRDMAMIMETHLLLGNTGKALDLASKVSKTLSHNYISTQDASFGLIAMAKLSEHMGKGAIAYDWSINGKVQTTMNQAAVFQEMDIKPQNNINLNFKNKGEGKLFIRLLARTQPVGDNVPAKDGDIRLFVRYLDDNGNEMDVSKLTQGTEFTAVVLAQNTSGSYVTDIALTQIFPSGWEIFNTRLFDAGRNEGQEGLFNYQDIRDDRVMTYFNLSSHHNKMIKIRLQAAYAGKFLLPGVTSDTMYNPDQHTRTTGQWVEVVQHQ